MFGMYRGIRLKTDGIKCRKIIYTLCFAAFCLIDQTRGSAYGGTQMIAVNCEGFLIAVIILSAYPLKDFLKLPYYIWTGVFLAGGTAACLWGWENSLYRGRWITGVLNVGVYGYILIRLFYKYVREKQPLCVNKPLFTVWCVMLLGMFFSKNEAVWPVWFLMMFGSFYLTDYGKDVREALFDSMINGLLLGFFAVQGAAFVFRPYDVLRYRGMYANENINVLFYAVTYAAWLCKWYRQRCEKRHIFLRGVTAFFASAMWGFAFLTMGRTGLLTMGILTVLFLVYCAITFRTKRVLRFIGTGALIATVAAVSFPLVFDCVRYLPPLFHHPIWFFDEYSEEKVHSWDPVDSEKYTDFDEFMQESFGRVLWFLDFSGKEVREFLRPSLIASAAEAGEEKPEAELSGNGIWADPPDGTGIDEDHPVLTDPEKIGNPVAIRTTIHRYYLQHLNFSGHKAEENGFWLTEGYYAPHAHNILLQFSFDFGILPGILFGGIGIWAVIIAFRETVKEKRREQNPEMLAMILFAAVLFSFGMLEICWQTGQNSLMMYFVMLYAVMRAKREEM